ncbi:MAG: SGNH/GDSL hydrolase family protein [Gemmatimonadota bacterium]|nr:SGNH/GDSL hydrolase family protein [Gemmatimonadota bacterium]
MRRYALVIAVLALGCGATSTGPDPDEVPDDADLTILFIGNSLTYTNNLPAMLQRLLESHGDVGTVGVGSIAFPNYGLQDHWAEGTARQTIADGEWDYVVIQQGPSATEGRPSLLDYSQRFADVLDPDDGRLALYMVWPASDRPFDFSGVSDSYATAAQQTGSLLFPAGEAWLAAWEIDSSLPLYSSDGFHPSLLGTYTAALVMYQQISGRDPRLLPPEIPATAGPIELPLEVSDAVHDAAVAANEAFALP